MRSRLSALAAALVYLTVGAPAFAQTTSATLDVAFAPGSPAPPVLNQLYTYELDVGSTGALSGLVVVDTVAVENEIDRVTTGTYSGLADFAAGEGVRVSYEKSTAPEVFTLWGSSPTTGTNTTLTAPPPGLGRDYITRVRWEFGRATDMRATVPATVRGRIRNPDSAGGPVAVGDTIESCARLSTRADVDPVCLAFDLIAGPAIAIDAPDSAPLGAPVQAAATLTGGAPTGTLGFAAFAAGDATCATALHESDVAVTGVGSFASDPFTALAAGAYKWVASYGGDSMHAAASTGCNDPSGAFAVVAPPSVSASFGAAEIDVGESTALSFTIANPAANTVPLTGVALENTLPAGLAVASPNGRSGGCGAGTITAAAQSVSLADGSIPAGASCTFSVDVTGTAAGSVTNTTGAVRSANGGDGNTATASLTIVDPPPPPTALELARACSPSDLVLLRVTRSGRRARVRGLAHPADVGRQVVIRGITRGQSGHSVAGRATVRPGGSFTATAPLPAAPSRVRYYAQLGDRRSPALKLVRRLKARLVADASGVTISGRVTRPLDTPVRRVVIRRLATCGEGYRVVARVRPDRRGRFRVTLEPGASPALYDAPTRVRSKLGGAMRAVSFVLTT